MVKAKKYLGQHFLKDANIARRIADLSQNLPFDYLLEIGPGTGMLTKFLLEMHPIEKIRLIEIDEESIVYLNKHYPSVGKLEKTDFLKLDLEKEYPASELCIIGNFPYNISSQIVFKALDHPERVVALIGMFQREVAQRICSEPGSKVYGILSVLCQTFFDCKYCFTVSESVFNPPPKVKSGVIELLRKKDKVELPVTKAAYFKIVKQAFQQRRKMLGNSLKNLIDFQQDESKKYATQRPEELSYQDFIFLSRFLMDAK